MRLEEALLYELWRLKGVHANVTYFVTAGELGAIRADPDASDRVNHFVQVYAALLFQVDKLAVLATVKRPCLEVVEWRRWG